MKKKVLFLLASLALVTTLAVNGTFAQEVGKVVDSLVEFVRDTIIGEPSADEGKLKVTLQFSSRESTPQVLAPSHYNSDFNWMRDIITVDGRKVWDQNKLSGAVDKFVAVRNESPIETNAYFRLAIAVRNDEVAQRVLKINLDTNPTDYVHTTQAIVINGIDYLMHVFSYQEVLAKGATTTPITLQVALTKETNNADMNDLQKDFLQIKVIAIEANAFIADANKNNETVTAADVLNQVIPLNSSFNPFN